MSYETSWPVDYPKCELTNLAERNPLPMDGRIQFDPEPHLYYVDGKQTVTSVTGLVKAPFPKFDTDETIKSMFRRGTAQRNYPEMSPEEIKEKWAKDAEVACNTGTKMHAAIEIDLNTGFRSNDVAIAPEMNMWDQFKQEEILDKALEVVRTEVPVFSLDGKLAGCVDCLLKKVNVEQNDPNPYALMDWKRSKEIKEKGWDYGFGVFSNLPNVNKVHYSLQLHVYRQLLAGFGVDVDPDEMYMVVFYHKNNSYQKIKALDLEDKAKYLLEHFDEFMVKKN